VLLTLPAAGQPIPAQVALPALPAFTARDSARADYGTKDLRQGFSVELRLKLNSLDAGQVLLDNRTPEGKGFCLQTVAGGAVEIVLNDGRSESRWACDPGLLQAGQRHHVVAIVDGGPKIISFVVDGRLCDGGASRQFGWGRFNPHFRGPGGDATLRIGGGVQGEIESLRIYRRAIRTSEAIGNSR
jgi:hypothetical protein